jgi:hypothetical protein
MGLTPNSPARTGGAIIAGTIIINQSERRKPIPGRERLCMIFHRNDED